MDQFNTIEKQLSIAENANNTLSNGIDEFLALIDELLTLFPGLPGYYIQVSELSLEEILMELYVLKSLSHNNSLELSKIRMNLSSTIHSLGESQIDPDLHRQNLILQLSGLFTSRILEIENKILVERDVYRKFLKDMKNTLVKLKKDLSTS